VEEKFVISLSEREEEGPKDVSLKIKSVFPKLVKCLWVFFTPQYQPLQILNTVNFTLKPEVIIGMQAPFLIFENRIIEKGIIACCINKPEANFKELFIKNDEPQNIESSLRASLKNQAKEKQFIFSLLSHQFNMFNYLRGVEMAYGKTVNIFGGGYAKKYFAKNYQLTNNAVEDGLINLFAKGVEFNVLSLGGFIPLGEPFTVTKAMDKRGIIMEINNQPAINIYKSYLGEKFDSFMKNYLFALYPLGIRRDSGIHLVSITNCLQDGSLTCIGRVKENTQAHLMLLQPSLAMDELKKTLEASTEIQTEIIFIINSLLRKKILREQAEEEVRLIKETLGEKIKIFGIYSDYSFFSHSETREFELETGNILMLGLK
jgi:hypothetical protein